MMHIHVHSSPKQKTTQNVLKERLTLLVKIEVRAKIINSLLNQSESRNAISSWYLSQGVNTMEEFNNYKHCIYIENSIKYDYITPAIPIMEIATQLAY